MTKREELIAADKAHVWHPYTAMKQYVEEEHPLVIERAQGVRLFDVDGRSFIDANASWWVALLGHGHPRLVKALRDQSERMCHVALAGITHEPAARLGEELCAVAPEGLNRVFFSDDGSTSVEVALKLALGYWYNKGRPERSRFLALEGAFHGDTLGVTGLGGVELFRRPFRGATIDCTHLTVPPAIASGADYERALEEVSRLMRGSADTLAAVVVEPLIQGAAGMRIYAAEYLQHLRRLCDEHDVLLVVDEVFTGYGRTGSMWACDQAEIAPDILCTAKGFSGGMLPMAATLTTEPVFEAFWGAKERAFYYGHTYCGHPLGAAIAREVLAIYRDEQILEGVKSRAERIARAFEQLAQLPGVKHGRSLGMVGAVDLSAGGGYLGHAGWAVYREALKRGAYLRPLGDVVYISPALNIPEDELETLLGIVEESIVVALRG